MDRELKYIKEQYEELSVRYHDLERRYQRSKLENEQLQDYCEKLEYELKKGNKGKVPG